MLAVMTKQWLATALPFVFLACAGDVPPTQVAPCPSGERPAVAENVLSLTSGAVDHGAELFAQQCARCHSRLVMERGSRLFRGYPRLDCADYQGAVSDAYLDQVIRQGGESVGLSGTMKPFGELLSDDDVAALIAYLRSAGA
ncbi:MAG: mono/diheme cytochrome c family protein [Myxococcota bacterium]|jgi:mono/diheme cytochrome c family protein